MSKKKREPEGFWKIPDPTPTPGETTNQNPQSTDAAVLRVSRPRPQAACRGGLSDDRSARPPSPQQTWGQTAAPRGAGGGEGVQRAPC